jgi:light-regulated signal transduction histidine kinase (bacteriophytochrome)
MPLSNLLAGENFSPAERMTMLAAKNLELARRTAEVETRNAELEYRLQEQTAGRQTAMKDLEDFSYSVAHDLRAPLRGIAGLGRALTAEHGAALNADGQRMLGLVCGETRQMGQLIDDLLAFVRIGRQAFDAAAIDMTELARSAWLQLTEAAPDVIASIEVRALPPAFGDRAMVRQVFANLLGNAIKFTKRQPTAKVEITGWNEGEWNTYCVSDNGVGFDPRNAHRLFGVFQRLHRQDDFEGSGVGLAVVHRILRRHGGRTWAEATPGAGAKFYFTLGRCQERKT